MPTKIHLLTITPMGILVIYRDRQSKPGGAMTEKPGQYNQDDGRPFNNQKSPSEIIAQSFHEGIQGFHWKADFLKFCEVLDLEPSDYADQKYQAFQELVERLNKFDAEMLGKMIDWGNPKR